MTSRTHLLIAAISAATLSAITATGLATAAPAQESAPLSTAPGNRIVTGNGTNETPFTAPCSNTSTEGDCLVDNFPARALRGMTNEFVPAYQCPVDHPWLTNYNYAPAGTALVPGVEISGLNPIGVSITGRNDDPKNNATLDGFDYAVVGTLTGFPYSSATNWSIDKHWYRVVLHCTNNFEHAQHHYRASPL
ncbi:hypothetical protein LQL77_30100 [Rhodococcus cerastii]|nr:hypothetical protein [Rhodococcus cerastii]